MLERVHIEASKVRAAKCGFTQSFRAEQICIPTGSEFAQYGIQPYMTPSSMRLPKQSLRKYV